MYKKIVNYEPFNVKILSLALVWYQEFVVDLNQSLQSWL